MRKLSFSSASVALLASLFCILAPAQGGPGADDAEKKADAPKVVPPFVDVGPGSVRPGCTDKEYADRHRGSQNFKEALQYDVWSWNRSIELPGFLFGRYEVTNAQWKYYLDRVHRREHTVGKNETLRSLAAKYVKNVDDKGIESEWKAFYSLNAHRIVEAWKNDAVPAKDGKPAKGPTWNPAWQMARPPAGLVAGGADISKLLLPEGLKIWVYTRRVPSHWYGWCKLAGLQSGLEYCDASKPAAEAFTTPEEKLFRETLRLRDTDFAAYPIRDVSPRDILEFCEWAGCDLPSEYEWERAGRGRKDWLYTWAPTWTPTKQKTLFPWADHPRAQFGTFRVDDPSVAASDSWVGARMMHGNVWELTRTFFDIHPRVTPEPPPVDYINYALIAKGGSFGDGWQKLALSMRTGKVGSAELSLIFLNRADTLGFRLVRHARPGQDLLRHSIMRLCYESKRGRWLQYPHAFSMERMAGMDEVHVQSAGPPYIHAKKKATAIAFAPLYFYEAKGYSMKKLVSTDIFTAIHRDYQSKKGRKAAYLLLGVLRTDVALRGGVRMTNEEAEKLKAERDKFKKAMREWQRLPKKRRMKIQKPGPPPPEPDEYEQATASNEKTCDLWRAGDIPAGEYYVLYWNGFYALANKALAMPPQGIFMINRKDREMRPKKFRRAVKDAVPACRILTKAEQDTMTLEIHIEEQVDKKKPRRVPDESKSSEWALAETTSKYWRGPPKPNQMWRLRVILPTAKGALAKHAFNDQIRAIEGVKEAAVEKAKAARDESKKMDAAEEKKKKAAMSKKDK